MFVAISLATSTEVDGVKKNKESPIFKIRNNGFIREKIKSRFIGENFFWVPVKNTYSSKYQNSEYNVRNKMNKDRVYFFPTDNNCPSIILHTCNCMTVEHDILCTLRTHCVN